MRLLLDTHLIVWAADDPERLSARTSELLENPSNEISFSVVSLWELTIKIALGRHVVRGDVRQLREGLLAGGYCEIGVTAEHALAVATLPPIHSDPFDRLLIAQARVERLTFLTADALVARYPGAIERA